MQLTSRSRRTERPIGSVVGETLVGTSLVLAGLWFVLIALTTPLVSSLSAAIRPAAIAVPAQVLFAWAAAIAAPMVLVLLGTERLARILAAARTGRWRRTRRDPFTGLAAGTTVARDITLDEGRSVATMVVGAFGIAVVHEAPPGEVGPWDDPREMVARDAERVRRWLLTHDVDFVVRIYAALVTDETSLPRTTSCAIVTPEQMPAWIASLPRQRSLTPERCTRIVELLRAGESGAW